MQRHKKVSIIIITNYISEDPFHVTCTSTLYNLYLNSNHQYTCIILIIPLPGRNYCAPSVSLRYVKRIVISYLFPQKCIQIEIASDKFRDPLLRKMSS